VKGVDPGRLAVAALFACACAHQAGAGDRGLLLDCDVPAANVFVDDYYLDHAAKWLGRTMSLRPGPHRVELVADGYYPAYEEPTVPERGFVRLGVHLRRLPE
jgi:hypothetical protein